MIEKSRYQMNRRTFLKNNLFSGLAIAITGLSGCGERLIRADDKQVLAMLQFQMPNVAPTNENVVSKIQQWMAFSGAKSEDTLTFVAQQGDQLTANGLVAVHLKGKTLKVSFNVAMDVVNPNLIRFEATHFRDLPGPLEGESDKAPIFFNQVKAEVLTLCDRLENYLGSETERPLSHFDQRDLI